MTVNRSDSASWKGLSLSYPAFRQDSGPLQVNSQRPSSMAADRGSRETLNPAETNVTTSDFNATFITLFQLHLSMAAKEAGEENFKQNQISSKSVFFSCAQFALYGRQTCRMDADCGGRSLFCMEVGIQSAASMPYVANLFDELPQVYEYVRIWLLRR